MLTSTRLSRRPLRSVTAPPALRTRTGRTGRASRMRSPVPPARLLRCQAPEVRERAALAPVEPSPLTRPPLRFISCSILRSTTHNPATPNFRRCADWLSKSDEFPELPDVCRRLVDLYLRRTRSVMGQRLDETRPGQRAGPVELPRRDYALPIDRQFHDPCRRPHIAPSGADGHVLVRDASRPRASERGASQAIEPGASRPPRFRGKREARSGLWRSHRGVLERRGTAGRVRRQRQRLRRRPFDG